MERGRIDVRDLLDAHGALPMARLVVAARASDVEVGTVTDEVLLVCGGDATAAPRPHWHPRLARRSPGEVEDARTAAVRGLVARGLVDRDGEHLTLRQPLATLSWALGSATRAVTWGVELAGEPASTGSALALPGGLALHDDIDRARGLHDLVLRPADDEAVRLAAIADPAGCSRRTDEPALHAGVDDLEGHVRAIPGRHRSRALLAAVAATVDDPAARAVTAVGTTEGLWLLQARGGVDAAIVVQQVGPDDLLAVTEGLLDPAPAPT